MLTEDVEVFEGVNSLLETMSKNNRLMLITKGDLFHQQRKIESSGLGRYFEAIEVVSEKEKENYQEIIDRYSDRSEQFHYGWQFHTLRYHPYFGAWRMGDPPQGSLELVI